jgi:hypothetical protein
LLLAKVTPPRLSDETWTTTNRDVDVQWRAGRRLLFGGAPGSADRIVLLGRLPVIALTLLASGLLWSWARDLFGEVTATALLALFALDPNILAHGSLLTTDLPLTCFTLGTFYFLWRCARSLCASNALAAAAFLAFALSSKFSGIVLPVLILVVLIWRSLRREPWPVRATGRCWALGTRPSRLAVAAGLWLVLGVLGWGWLWSVYGFRSNPTFEPNAHFPIAGVLEDARSRAVSSGSGLKLAAVETFRFVADQHLLPESYLFGLLDTYRNAERPSYLHGTIAKGGRWDYFPVAVAVKTPLPTLVAITWAAAFILLKGRRLQGVARDNALPFLVVPLAGFFAAGVSSKLDIGLRHVLPIYPFLFLLAGWPIQRALGHRRGRIVLAVLGGWLLAATVSIWPHELAYFNEVAGGPKNGARWLVDSNLDWGQGLTFLKKWMDDHGVGQINLCYFGTVDPASYGIGYVRLRGGSAFSAQPVLPPKLPGLVAISATNLAGVWQDASDREYYRRLLRGLRPIAKVGYSIFIYEVGTSPPSVPGSGGDPG